MPRITILTGTSRGLGGALAAQLIQSVGKEQGHLVTLSRKKSEALETAAKAQNTTLTQIEADLSDRAAIERAGKLLHALVAGFNSVRVIHNAGVVTPIAQAEAFSSLDAINNTFQINITAPIYLTAEILSASRHTTDRRIMLISSGAGRNASSGWGVYCATKAAMDRYAECAQLDEGERARIVSMAPGIMDTDMQETIRATPKTDFPSLERFVNLHQQKQLTTPEDVARKLLIAMENDSFGATTIDDIRQHTF